MCPFWKLISGLLFSSLLVLGTAAPAHALTDQEELIEKSKVTAESMFSDPNYPALRTLAARAKAVLIVPSLVKLSFFIGGRGGNGVLIMKDEQGNWSPPAFYSIGGLSYGLQIGGQSSELIITIMSEKGLKAVVERQATLGADAGLAVAGVGIGAQAATGMGLNADMYSFARSSGLYVGVSVDGSVLSAKETWNEEFYGTGATPRAIMVERKVTAPPKVAELIGVMP